MHQNSFSRDNDKTSTAERSSYVGQTSLLPTSTANIIKDEPGVAQYSSEQYGFVQNQSPYPYQQIFGLSGSTSGASGEVGYHHQHHVTAAAKLMASS